MPAHATAKIVIASAKRLIELRQGWRRSSRIAEMSVPACPMPIHQTKLTISKPQPTGWLTPQMPMPRKSSHAIAASSTIVSEKPTAAPKNHARGVRRDSAIDASLSVSVANE